MDTLTRNGRGTKVMRFRLFFCIFRSLVSLASSAEPLLSLLSESLDLSTTFLFDSYIQINVRNKVSNTGKLQQT